MVTFLKTRGFSIFKQNWRTPYGEVDLVAEKGTSLWVIEVKTRRETDLGRRVVLGFPQRKRLTSAALWIWQKHEEKYDSVESRLAVVTERSIKWINLPLLSDHA